MRTEYHLFVWLCVAWCAALPSTARAQQRAAPEQNQQYAHSVGIKGYSCVDPSDAMAHRQFQDEPCKLPMYHLPLTRVPGLDEPTRWPAFPPRSPTAQEGHAMFWRFPVQPLGPHGAPRHNWR
jgi:hypothetical protein